MKCLKCGEENLEMARFCSNCGSNLEEESIIIDPEPMQNKINVVSAIVLLFLIGLISIVVVSANNSNEVSSDDDVEYIAYEEEIESFEYSKEELFMESEKTITYNGDGYIQHQNVICYDTDGKIIEESDAQDDDSWEVEISYVYDDYGRISEISLNPYSTYAVNITLDVYSEDEDGNFVSEGIFYDPEHYSYDVTCKYDNDNRLLEFYIYKYGEIYTYDKGDKMIYAYENRSYYDDGVIEYKERKFDGEIIKLFYNEDGSLNKKIVSERSTGPSSEYYYKHYKGIDIQVSAVDVDRVATDWGYEHVSTELNSDVVETENRIEVTNFREGEIEGYITWEFDENGNKTKMSEYNADYELKSETYYTWIEKSAYFDSYD